MQRTIITPRFTERHTETVVPPTAVRRNALDLGRILIFALQSKIEEVMRDLLPTSGSLALLDFPNHDNIGDSAIYHGEIAFLKRWGIRPSYVSTTENCQWDKLTAEIGDGPILLHGGGNFGDLWPWFQPFREEVLARNTGRPVVQLPQTIYYQSRERLDQTARVIERHGAFTLLVRDQRSYDLARANFQCDVRLCPDMAFCIGSVERGLPEKKLLLHLRNDHEAARIGEHAAFAALPGVVESDWPTERSGWIESRDRRRLPLRALAAVRHGRAAIREARYRGRAAMRVQRGFDLLSSADYVITDRMHGHIMCLLLGIPHCVIDNSYGKTSGLMNTWGTGIGNVHTATSVADGVARLVDKEGLQLPGFNEDVSTTIPPEADGHRTEIPLAAAA